MYQTVLRQKTEEMCKEAVHREPYTLRHVPDHLKTQKICEEAEFFLFPDHFKTQKLCDKAVRDDSSSLQYVPNWFVTREWAYMRYDDSEYCDDDDDDDDEYNFFKWYHDYKKRKAKKASIKEELLPIAWHPSRDWDWCMSGDKKKGYRSIVGINMDLLLTGYKKIFDQKEL